MNIDILVYDKITSFMTTAEATRFSTASRHLYGLYLAAIVPTFIPLSTARMYHRDREMFCLGTKYYRTNYVDDVYHGDVYKASGTVDRVTTEDSSSSHEKKRYYHFTHDLLPFQKHTSMFITDSMGNNYAFAEWYDRRHYSEYHLLAIIAVPYIKKSPIFVDHVHCSFDVEWIDDREKYKYKSKTNTTLVATSYIYPGNAVTAIDVADFLNDHKIDHRGRYRYSFRRTRGIVTMTIRQDGHPDSTIRNRYARFDGLRV